MVPVHTKFSKVCKVIWQISIVHILNCFLFAFLDVLLFGKRFCCFHFWAHTLQTNENKKNSKIRQGSSEFPVLSENVKKLLQKVLRTKKIWNWKMFLLKSSFNFVSKRILFETRLIRKKTKHLFTCRFIQACKINCLFYWWLKCF